MPLSERENTSEGAHKILVKELEIKMLTRLILFVHKELKTS